MLLFITRGAGTKNFDLCVGTYTQELLFNAVANKKVDVESCGF